MDGPLNVLHLLCEATSVILSISTSARRAPMDFSPGHSASLQWSAAALSCSLLANPDLASKVGAHMIGEDLKALVSHAGSSEVLDPLWDSFECGVTTPEHPNQQECLCVFLTKHWLN